MVSDKYYNIITKTLTLSAADTATGTKINLPSDWRTKQMVLIHKVEMYMALSPTLLEADGTNWIACSLNWGQDLGPLLAASEEFIAGFKEMYHAVASATPEVYGSKTILGKKSWEFDKPIPVAQDSLGFDGNTTGQTPAIGIFGLRIYFTVKAVTEKDWQEVLEARHGYQE